jgi:hypothetical protein
MNNFTNELKDFHLERLAHIGDAMNDIRTSTIKYYAGVGSRKTPESVCNKMANIARVCESRGYVLRSGGADGADSAFESGLKRSLKEIFFAEDIPNDSPLMEITAKYHPNWNACVRRGPYVMKLMARNVLQILGKDLKSPVNAVVCWTPNGDGSGGTGQAIRIANAYNIPVFDLGTSLSEDQRTKQWHKFLHAMDDNEY